MRTIAQSVAFAEFTSVKVARKEKYNVMKYVMKIQK